MAEQEGNIGSALAEFAGDMLTGAVQEGFLNQVEAVTGEAVLPDSLSPTPTPEIPAIAPEKAEGPAF